MADRPSFRPEQLLPAHGHLRRALVVGAGVAGLQVARQLKKLGIQVVVLEASNDIGGVWAQNYDGYGLQTPWKQYQFPEFLWPKHLQPEKEYPSGDQVQAYIRAYAKHFDLMQHVRLNCKLLRLRWNPEARGWECLYADAADEKFYKTRVDYTVICCGLYSNPHIPDYKGSESFVGVQLHAKYFTDMTIARGRRVLIVGAGKTGVDCACGLVATKTAASVTLLYRQAHWPIPRTVLGASIRSLLFTRAATGMLPPYYTAGRGERAVLAVAKPLQRLFWKGLECAISSKFRTVRTTPPAMGLPEDLFYGGQILDDTLDELMGSEVMATVKGEVNRFVRNGVILQDGSFLPVDVVMYATGYSKTYEYFDGGMRSKLGLQKDGLYLYRNCLPHAVPHLAFVGSEVSTYSNILTDGLQALWLAHVLSGRVKLPLPAAMAEDIRAQQRWRREVMPSQRSRGSVLMLYMVQYHDQLLRDMGHSPRRKRLNPFAECFGTYTSADYTAMLSKHDEEMAAAVAAATADAKVRRAAATAARAERGKASVAARAAAAAFNSRYRAGEFLPSDATMEAVFGSGGGDSGGGGGGMWHNHMYASPDCSSGQNAMEFTGGSGGGMEAESGATWGFTSGDWEDASHSPWDSTATATAAVLAALTAAALPNSPVGGMLSSIAASATTSRISREGSFYRGSDATFPAAPGAAAGSPRSPRAAITSPCAPRANAGSPRAPPVAAGSSSSPWTPRDGIATAVAAATPEESLSLFKRLLRSGSWASPIASLSSSPQGRKQARAVTEPAAMLQEHHQQQQHRQHLPAAINQTGKQQRYREGGGGGDGGGGGGALRGPSVMMAMGPKRIASITSRAGTRGPPSPMVKGLGTALSSGVSSAVTSSPGVSSSLGAASSRGGLRSGPAGQVAHGPAAAAAAEVQAVAAALPGGGGGGGGGGSCDGSGSGGGGGRGRIVTPPPRPCSGRNPFVVLKEVDSGGSGVSGGRGEGGGGAASGGAAAEGNIGHGECTVAASGVRGAGSARSQDLHACQQPQLGAVGATSMLAGRGGGHIRAQSKGGGGVTEPAARAYLTDNGESSNVESPRTSLSLTGYVLLPYAQSEAALMEQQQQEQQQQLQQQQQQQLLLLHHHQQQRLLHQQQQQQLQHAAAALAVSLAGPGVAGASHSPNSSHHRSPSYGHHHSPNPSHHRSPSHTHHHSPSHSHHHSPSHSHHHKHSPGHRNHHSNHYAVDPPLRRPAVETTPPPLSRLSEEGSASASIGTRCLSAGAGDSVEFVKVGATQVPQLADTAAAQPSAAWPALG